MRKSSAFSEILDAAEKLSIEEREALLEVLRHRFVADRRAGLKREIADARRQRAAGKCAPGSARQIMRDILK